MVVTDEVIVDCCGIHCSTGRRRYNHPAISGRLPLPWLPAGKSDYLQSASDILPSSAEIEAVQEPLDLDLSSSGAVLIDLRRRFQDFRNLTKRAVVKGVERMRSPGGGTVAGAGASSTSGRRSSGPRRTSGARIRSDEEYINDSTNAWARNDGGLSSSPGDGGSWSVTSGEERRKHLIEDHDSSDDEAEGGSGSRYVFFPHRQPSSREATAEPDTEGDDE